MNRGEHLAWCKKRALEFVDNDDLQQAYASMVSDLQKHDETVNHIGIELGMMQMLSGMLDDKYHMRKFIEGFN